MRLAFKAIIAAVILVLSLAVPMLAGPFEDAVLAHDKGDYATALRLFRPLANQGNADAQSILGWMYAGGKGVPQDHAEGVKWYRLAANQGHVGAQFNLGVTYGGHGVTQDYVEAAKWYRLAANQGHATAQIFLGVMYDLGNGVPQDIVSAHMWFNLSAAQGVESAADMRKNLERRMTPAQIAEAQKMAREWKPTKP